MIRAMVSDKNQLCGLVSYTETQDSAGFTGDSRTRIAKQVWCGVSSVSGQEIARFGQNGIKPALKVAVWADEYDDQEEVLVNGKLYGVYRTYQSGADEVELYLERKAGVVNG